MYVLHLFNAHPVIFNKEVFMHIKTCTKPLIINVEPLSTNVPIKASLQIIQKWFFEKNLLTVSGAKTS
jgi:hypothetical protein